MTINVTAEDIAAGARADCKRCPIALAIKRATGEQYEVEDSCNISVRRFMKPREWFLGESRINEFIAAFDDGRPVAPFSFELNPKPDDDEDEEDDSDDDECYHAGV